MRARRRIAARLRDWFRPDALDAEVSEELRFHLQREIDANLEAGMTLEHARRAARLTIGSIESVREESRSRRPGSLARQTIRDLSFGFRLLRRSPGFAATSVLVVALGIGTTTTIFSVVYGVMLRPLPYAEPDRLVALWSLAPNSAERVKTNPADVRDLRAATSVFEDIALANAPQNFNLIGSGEPERLVAARLASNVFSVLRVNPALGRPFTSNDEQSGNDRVAILSDRLWRRRFGADPTIVGRTINLSGTPYEVVGVMRPGFQFPEREHELWIPLTIDPRLLLRQIAGYNHFAIARLKRGADIEQAERDVAAVAARLEAEHPNTNRGVRLEVLPMLEETVRAVRPALYVLLAAVASLLLIACLNLASLLATRAAGRTREFAVRAALGASGPRLALQAVSEVIPVLVPGGVLGVVAAKAAIAVVVPIAPAALPRVDAIEVSGAVLTVSVALVVLTGLLAAILPAMHAWRVRIAPASTGSRSAIGSPGQVRTRAALVVAQVALTLPLLVAATSLARSFSALVTVDPGFRTENVLSVHMAIPRSKYRTDQEITAFYTRILDHVRAIPGVASAGMVNRVPLTGNNLVMAVAFGDAAAEPRPLQSRSATPDYFKTLGIPLRDGRVFTERDTQSAPFVGIVDERLARSLWPNETAVGKRFQVTLPGQQPASGEIVGVVGNIRHQGLETDEDRQIYFSYHQFTDGRIALLVRSATDMRVIAPAVIQAIRALDPDQPVYDVRSMDEVLARSAAQRWFNMAILAVFAASSLLLAGVGLYGVIAHGVTGRIREFGLRMALGAMPSEISRLVLGRGLGLAGSGCAIGLAGAVLLTNGMESLLYGVPALDPFSFATAIGVVLVVALTASYVPARRASASDLTHALRAE